MRPGTVPAFGSSQLRVESNHSDYSVVMRRRGDCPLSVADTRRHPAGSGKNRSGRRGVPRGIRGLCASVCRPVRRTVWRGEATALRSTGFVGFGLCQLSSRDRPWRIAGTRPGWDCGSSDFTRMAPRRPFFRICHIDETGRTLAAFRIRVLWRERRRLYNQYGLFCQVKMPALPDGANDR